MKILNYSFIALLFVSIFVLFYGVSKELFSEKVILRSCIIHGALIMFFLIFKFIKINKVIHTVFQSLLIGFLVFMIIFYLTLTQRRSLAVVILPKIYPKEITIFFNVNQYPKLNIKDGIVYLNIDTSGLLLTSSPIEDLPKHFTLKYREGNRVKASYLNLSDLEKGIDTFKSQPYPTMKARVK